MLQETVQARDKDQRIIFFTIKGHSVVAKLLSNHRKNVATKFSISRQSKKAKGKNVCRDSFQKQKSMRSWLQQILCRDIRHSYCNMNKIVASKLCRDIIKFCHDGIQEKA